MLKRKYRSCGGAESKSFQAVCVDPMQPNANRPVQVLNLRFSVCNRFDCCLYYERLGSQ